LLFVFLDVDLAGASSLGVDLAGVSFLDVDLAGVSFLAVDLAGVSFLVVDLAGVSFLAVDLAAAFLPAFLAPDDDFLAADLGGVAFLGADLAGVAFLAVDLAGDDFLAVDLAGVTFLAVDLAGVAFLVADLAGAFFLVPGLAGAASSFSAAAEYSINDGAFVDAAALRFLFTVFFAGAGAAVVGFSFVTAAFAGSTSRSIGAPTLESRRTDAERKEMAPFFARSISNPVDSESSFAMNVGVVLVVCCAFLIPH